MIGFHTKNGVEKYYDGLNRFSYVNIGVAIPISFKATKARIKALSFDQQIAENNAKLQEQQLTNNFNATILQYKQD
ncbi:MAG: TolC family protein, partial [Algoriella sp.]